MPILIFIPQCVNYEDNSILYGSFHLSTRTNLATFYISMINHKIEENENDALICIGQYNKNEVVCEIGHNTPNWLIIQNKNNNLTLKKVVVKGEIVKFNPSKAVFIFYDKLFSLNTEFLLLNVSGSQRGDENYLKVLLENINHCHIRTNKNQRSRQKIILTLESFIVVLNSLLLCFAIFLPIYKFSSLCIRVHNSIETIRWVLKSFVSNRTLTLQTRNFIFASFIDVICGYMMLYWFMALVSSTQPSQLLLKSAENVVQTLQELLTWLMGIPAGLKLNFAFNNMLGKFFLYHINLWWTFLVLAEPVLEFIFTIFLCFGQLGLSFQAAILADLLALASFHVYCVYVYAARLYNLQISGLLALWRLFLGRKKNPLRKRVDSCRYSANQLFIGTLAFTILLFLLPTTFMYYIVFATLRLLVAALAGLLIRIQFLLQITPLYTAVLWLLKPTSVSTNVCLQVKRRQTGLPMILSMIPMRGSLWTAFEMSMPGPVKKPANILWGSLLKNILTGQLIYPM